jgi:AraC-like DNA-binding protein
MRLGPAPLKAFAALVEVLEEEIESGLDGYEACAKGAFLQLCALLSRHYLLSSAGVGTADPLLALARVLSHMERHFGEEQRLPRLARLAGMSERSLRRHFESAVGRSPAEHLLDIRLEEARRRLEESDDSVTAVSLACGFSDPNYFARQFRRRHGRSPRRWRLAALEKATNSGDVRARRKAHPNENQKTGGQKRGAP